MSANGVDGEVQIPIKFTVDDDTNVYNYINELKRKLESVKNLMKSSDGKGLDSSAEIQKSIDALDNYIKKIEDSRAKILHMQQQMEAAKDSLDLAKSDKPFAIGDFKVTKSDIDKSIAEAQKELNDARTKYLEQSPQYLRDLKTAASMANAAATNLDNLTNATSNVANATASAKPKVDLFKQSLQQFKTQFKEKFNADMGLPQVEESINNIKLALQTADNALESMHKTASGKMVTVDPNSTDELKEQYDVLTDQYTELEYGLQIFEKFKSMITDGSVTEALRQGGESTEQWVADINNLAKECQEAIPLLIDMAKEYEHIARATALSATKTNKGVVESADTTKTGKASTVIEEQNAIEKAEAEREAAQKKADEEAEARTKNQIKRINREIAAVKQSTAQYYYKLRAVKMLGFAIKSIDTAITKFAKNTVNATSKMLAGYLRLIPGVNALRRALDKTHTSQKKLNKEMRNSTKSSKGLITSAKQLLSFMLKYTLGIRSIYVMFNKLRKAIVDGIGQLARGSAEVNKSMSSIATSINQMKAAITTIVEPIVHVLAPVLERISALITNISYQMASFIAALGGQSMVFKATRKQIDYAESLDSTAKSAKKAKQELSGLDKLNVINSKDNDDDMSLGFEKVPIDDTMAEWANKFKEFLNKLLKPVKDAWAKMRNFVTKSFKKMLKNILSLGKSIARDFWKVWEEPKTQQIFENIFKVLGDIFLIIGNIAKAFKTAWDANDNGYKILSSIRDVIWIISKGLRDCADYTVRWSEKLTFVPLFDALANVMQQKLVPAVQQITDLLTILYEQILLKIVKDIIEKGLPQLVNIAGPIIGAIGNIAENIRIALQSGSEGILIVDRFEQLLQVVADGIEYCAKKTEEWAKDLDFRNLMSSLRGFLEDIKPLIQFLTDTFSKFWTDVLLPFWKYLAEQGAPEFLQKFGDIISNIDWEKATSAMNTFMEALEPFFELAWEVITRIILDLTSAFGDLVESGVLNSVAEGFKEWVEGADPESIATTIEHLAVELIGLVGALNLVSGVIMPIIINYMTFGNLVRQMSMPGRVAELTEQIAKLHPELAKASPQVSHFTGLMKTFAGIFAIGGGLVIGIKNFFKMWEEGVTPVKAAIEVLAGALVGLGLVILGIASWPAIVIGALVGIAVTIVALVHEHWDEIKSIFTDTIPDWWNNTAVPFIQSIPEKIREFFNKIPEYMKELHYNIGEWFGEMLGSAARWVVDLDAKIKELGENFKAWWSETAWPWIKSLPEKVWEGIKGIPEKVKEMKDEAVRRLGELGTEIKQWWTGTAWPWITSLPGKIWQGFKDGINRFKDSIKELGRGFFDGFRRGFEEEADINSPSKEMAKEGKFLTDGAIEGVDSEWQKLDDLITQLTSELIERFNASFENISGEGLVDSFYDSFISKTSQLTSAITTMFDDMSSHISDVMNNLGNIDMMRNFNSQFANISNMRIPDIVKGYELPSNAEFKVSTTDFDMSDLPDIIKNAVIEAITSTADLQSDDETTIINIDGKTVFQVVKDENTKYKKQHGKSALV